MKTDSPKMPWRVPLKVVCVLGLGLLVAAALGSVIYLGFSVAAKNTNQLLSDKVESTLDAIAVQVDKHLQPVESQALRIARAFESGELTLQDTDKLQTYFRGILTASSQVSAIGLIKPDRKLIALARQSKNIFAGPWPDEPFFTSRFLRTMQQKEGRWEPPSWSPRLNQSIMVYYMPVVVDGQFIAALAQTIPIADLSRFLSQETYLHGVPYIYYDNDKLIAHPKLISWRPLDDVKGGSVIRISDIGEALLEDLLSMEGFVPEMLSHLTKTESKIIQLKDRDYLVFTRVTNRYTDQPWSLGLYIDARSEGEIVRRLINTFVVAVGFLVFTVAVAIYAGVLLSRPMRSLAGSMEQVRHDKIADVKALPHSRITEIDDAAQSFNEMVSGLKERDLIRKTLGRYVPKKVAESLLKEGGALQTEESIATVLFADIEGFTNLTENLGPERIVDLLNAYFGDMVDIIERYDGVVTQFQGDAILATFNIPIVHPSHAANALNAALEMRGRCQTKTFARQVVRARIGISTGHLVAGAVGAQGRLNYTVHGDAVNLAARVENLNKVYGTYILFTQSTLDHCPEVAGIFMGETTVRGQSKPVKLYTLADPAA